MSEEWVNPTIKPRPIYPYTVPEVLIAVTRAQVKFGKLGELLTPEELAEGRRKLAEVAAILQRRNPFNADNHFAEFERDRVNGVGS
jgi:hypothetical protein